MNNSLTRFARGDLRSPATSARRAASAASLPFDCILIANRGEIAVRIARTCRAMGVRTIAVYSDPDAGSPHVRACDSALRIGPAPAVESYLSIPAILGAARRSGAQAIHPGYGFLAENPDFAQMCVDSGIIFVGPPAGVMRAVGNKVTAKNIAQSLGIPTVPGYLGEDQDFDTLRTQARAIGTPLIIKAAAGGGGKGMRLVENLAQFDAAAESAKREATAAFGEDRIFLERYLEAPRHIEVQVLADAHGNCIHLGERECSVQRRHQKIVEETPSPAVDETLRSQLGDAAVQIAKAVGYTSAGTVEFMLDGESRFYFLEVNARLQVEHPITEAVTGIDLVREQLLIAAGQRLTLSQKDVAPQGHAIEARIYAEDPGKNFLPSSGHITTFEPPQGPGIRNDVGIDVHTTVTTYYDPLLAKLIAHDQTRDACIARLAEALDAYLIGGVTTNIAFLRWLIDQPAFKRAETTTAFIDQNFHAEVLMDPALAELAQLSAAAAINISAIDVSATDVAFERSSMERVERSSTLDPWLRLGPWRHSLQPREIIFEGNPAQRHTVERAMPANGWRVRAGDREALVRPAGAGAFLLESDKRNQRFAAWRSRGGIAVSLGGQTYEFKLLGAPTVATATKVRVGSTDSMIGRVEAPMSGTIVKVDVKRGDVVREHQTLMIMEAMKMEHAIAAPYDGIVTAISMQAGATVTAGEVLAQIEAGEG